MSKSNRRILMSLIIRTVVRIAILAGAVFLLVSAGKYAYHVGYSVFTSGAMAEEPGEDVMVTIGDQMSDREIGQLLQSKGLIEDSLVFVIQAKVYEYDPLPGTYLLNTSQTLDRMMEIMTTTPQEDISN